MSGNSPGGLRIRVFGTFRAEVAGVPVQGLHLREGERLLAYLTLKHDQSIPYKTLAETFWPAEARQNATYSSSDYHSARQAIYHLRQVLGSEAHRLTNPAKGFVRLDLNGADVDMMAFERLAQQNEPAAWSEALALRATPLLEGWPEAWAEAARRNTDRTFRELRERQVEHPGQAFPIEAGRPAEPPIPSAALPQPAPVPANRTYMEVEEGVVPLGSAYYIERPVDGQFTTAIARRDGIVLLKGTKQSGKTSLLARGLQRAREAGTRVVLTDLQLLNASDLETADTLACALAEMIADQLELDVSPADVWNARRGANVNLDRFVRREVLARIETPVLWALDEVDMLFAYPYCSELFGLFRSWHNERSLNPAAPWTRLTLAMVYATEAHLFISDLNQSPFNVGTRLSLHDFTREQVADLNSRYGTPLQTEPERERFYSLVSGHPYLSHRGIAEIATNRLSLEELEKTMSAADSIYSGHLRRLLDRLLQDTELTEVLRGLVHGKPCPSDRAFYRLRSAGLLRGEHHQEAQWRCRIYESYFACRLF